MGKERKLLAQDFVLWETGESLGIACSSQLLPSAAGCSDPHNGLGSMALSYQIKTLTIELFSS